MYAETGKILDSCTVRVAQSRGVYAIEDAGLLAQAIGMFTPDPEPTPVEVTEEEPESDE